jgi:hypothetical protein
LQAAFCDEGGFFVFVVQVLRNTCNTCNKMI